MCRRPLPFEEWSRGEIECRACAAPALRAAGSIGPPPVIDYRTNDQMLDEVPPELIEELVAAIEAEASARRRQGALPSPVQGVIDEIGLGRSPRELPWATWGFVAGFAINLAIAKYAQVTTAAPLHDFLGPMVLGGLLAGTTCAAIAWGIVRLREP